ncbi:MAG: hypothetical protein KGL43_00755 [Burkholderiales bacterium]|nr:hypothetical protein [Burkholderiales bacterium]MDE2452095.1 hypothetical protein [Burkholderiales bacterium]
MKPIRVFSLLDLDNPVQPAPLSDYILQFLAQGDSWFSFGALPMWQTSNLFDGMGTSQIAACAVNCAAPGARLSVMANSTTATPFLQLLSGNRARRWAGLLLSGGGNDLIAAVQQAPENRPEMRLLATAPEWIDAPGGERYLSNAGWLTFSTHIIAVMANLLAVRDSGINRGLPIVMHTYDIAVPRDSGAGFGFGPWLYPAMQAYAIPPAAWPAVAAALLDRLWTLLDHIAANTVDGSIHVVHSQGTLTPAQTSDTGASADWQNEIHPTRAGYQKLSALWLPLLDAVFASRIQGAPG